MGDGDLLAAVVAHYSDALERSDDACSWLAAHGIEAEIAGRWSVGFSDRTLGLVLPGGEPAGGGAAALAAAGPRGPAIDGP